MIRPCTEDKRGKHEICGCGSDVPHCMWCLEDLNEEEVAEIRERNSYWYRLFHEDGFLAAHWKKARRKELA